MNEKFPYEDIIHLAPHISKKHPQPTMMERAARFSPFAAVTGYEDMVQEEARYTIEKGELDESEKEKLSEKLRILTQNMAQTPRIAITYFQSDKSKNGGQYVEIQGVIKQIDEYHRSIHLQDGRTIWIENIYDITGNIFDQNESV